MLLKDKVAVITGGAGPNGLGFATAKLMAQHGARVAVLDLAGAEPAAAAAKLGDGHFGRGRRRDRQGVVRRRHRRGAQGLRPHRRAGQQRGHHAAAQDGGHHQRRLRRGARCQPARHLADVAGRDPADAAPARRLDRLHLVGLGAARRRHPRRPALLGRQGRRARPGPRDGTRTGYRRGPRQLHHPRADRDRHQKGKLTARRRPRSRRRYRSAASAPPPMSRAPAFSWPATSRPTAPASRST